MFFPPPPACRHELLSWHWIKLNAAKMPQVNDVRVGTNLEQHKIEQTLAYAVLPAGGGETIWLYLGTKCGNTAIGCRFFVLFQ